MTRSDCKGKLVFNLLHGQFGNGKIATPFFTQELMGIEDRLLSTLDGNIHRLFSYLGCARQRHHLSSGGQKEIDAEGKEAMVDLPERPKFFRQALHRKVFDRFDPRASQASGLPGNEILHLNDQGRRLLGILIPSNAEVIEGWEGIPAAG